MRNRVSALAFSHDGKLLAAGDGAAYGGTSWISSSVSLWDALTGEALLPLEGHSGHVRCLAFSPDCKRLASGSVDHTILLWNTPSLKPVGKSELPTPKQLETWWSDLASSDAGIAHQAVCKLVRCRNSTVPFLKSKVRPLPTPDLEKTRTLIGDLNDAKFQIRQEAFRLLEAMEDTIEPALRKSLENPPALEAKRRIEALVAMMEPASTKQLRNVRVLGVLERIDTIEAHQAIESWVGGTPMARLTREAKASLERMKR